MTERPAMLGALRHRGFALFLSARSLATLAVQMQSVAVGWQVYDLTGDPLDLGLVGLAQFLPFILLILIAGHVADRFSRRAILALCYAVEVLCAGLLLWFTVSGAQVVWPVFGVLVLFGSARAFAMPTAQALTPNLVPRESFGNAVALHSTFGHGATIVGPVLGGLLYLVGPEVVYSVVMAILLISVGLMLAVRVPATVRTFAPATWSSLLDGLRFVRSRPVVLGAISLDLFAVLFGGARALLPAFASDILHTGPDGLGLLRTAPAVGAAAIAVVMTIRPIRRRVGAWMFGGVALFAVSTIGFGLSTQIELAVAALILLGAGDMVSVYIRHVLVQLETPDEIRGRVSAVNAVFIGASNELGEFESGVTAAWWGLVPAILVGGGATLLVTGLWMRWFPSLRRMDRFPEG